MRAEVGAPCMSTFADCFSASDLSKDVERILEGYGLSPINPAIKGRSGVIHTFDAAAKDGVGTLVVVDFVRSEVRADELPLLRFYVKCMDTEPERRILVCIPGADDKAKRLAPLFGITLVEGRDLHEAWEGLRSALMIRRK